MRDGPCVAARFALTNGGNGWSIYFPSFNTNVREDTWEFGHTILTQIDEAIQAPDTGETPCGLTSLSP